MGAQGIGGPFRNPDADGAGLTASEILWVQTGEAGVLLLEYQVSSPSNTANYGKVYAKTDDNLYYMDEAGTEYQLNGGSGVSVVTPTGTVNAVNTAFTVISQPKWVVGDGMTYFEGSGYTYLAGTITMDIPPSQYIRAIL